MFNDLERLRDCAELFTLLTHYADLAGPDRQAWQDRLMRLDGPESRGLTRLHGELLAYGWLEQNCGNVPLPCKGEAPACYRVTREGLRALNQVKAGEID